jgi:hypothetical protein
MIVYDLHCSGGHRFEGWFGSSADYEDQRCRGLVACPQCGCADVSKAPMAPAVPAKGNTRSDIAPDAAPESTTQVANLPMPPEMRQALEKIAKAQAEALKQSTWVGDKFAEKSRAMHYGEEDSAPIHGQASLDEAKALAEEGVPIAPVLFPVAPPDKLN